MAKILIKFLDDLSPSELKLRDLPRKPDGLYNLAFNEYGQEVKRAGYEEYNTNAIGGGSLHKILGMHRFYNESDDTKEFIVAWNKGWYKISDESGHAYTTLLSKAGTDFTTTADMDTYWADFYSHCYGVNTKGLWKYNGKYVRTVGITIPNAPTFVNNTITGELEEGTYYFKITYVDEDVYESNGGTELKADGVKDKGIRISIPQSTDAKVNKRRIYRTTVGGSIYYYDGIVTNNDASQTYDSDISDAEISLKSVLHTDHNAPPSTPSLIVKRLSRLNIAVDDDLYVSKNYDKTTGVRSVEYFPSTNYFPTGNGQKITGLIEQLSGLPVFTKNTIERLVGTDEVNFEFRNAHQEDGCIAKRSAVSCKNYIVYLAFNGIYIFDGVSAREIDVAFGGRLNKYIRENINYSYAHLSCASYYDNKYLLCIPTGESAVPNTTIYYDFATKSYGVYSFAFSCFSKWDKGGDGLSLKGGSNTIGRVYSVLSGLDDDGSAITAYDDIEPIDFGRPEVYKQWYSIFIKIKTTTETALAMYYTLDNGTETSSNMVSRNDITFVEGAEADTITTVAGDFVAAGFKEGDVIVITGTGSNNKNMTIVSVVAKTITLATGVVTAEGPADAILTKAKILTENTTKWYRISLGSGGKMARALKPRPYISDKFHFEIHGLAICYDEETFAEEKD